MSDVNASIPLSGDNQGLDVSKMLSLADMAQQMKMHQTKMQNQNAMSQVLANPQSYDQNGNINQNALRVVTAADPQVGIEMKNQTIQEQLKQAQEAHYKTEAGKAAYDFGARAAGAAYDVYEDTLKSSGGNEKVAVDAATAAHKEMLANNGGVLSTDQVQRGSSETFDPIKYKNYAGMSSEWVAERRAQQVSDSGVKREDRADKREALAEQHETASEKQAVVRDNLMFAALKNKESNPDPKRDAYEAYKKENPKATAQQLADFVQGMTGQGGSLTERAKELQSELTIQGVALPQGLRSAKMLTQNLNNIVEQHPDKSAAELTAMIRSGTLDMKAATSEAVQVAKREGNIGASAKALTEKGGLYDQLDAAAAKVNLGDSKMLSSIRLGLQKHVYANDDIRRYVTVLEDTRADLTNVLARTGQATETVRTQAINMFPDNMKLSELRTAIDASKKVTAAVMSGNEKVMEALKAGKPIMEAAGVADLMPGDEKKPITDKPKSAHPEDIQAILDKYQK